MCNPTSAASLSVSVSADSVTLPNSHLPLVYVKGEPINHNDPLGMFDIIAAAWHSNYPMVLLGQVIVGHVVLANPQGAILTSQFPTPHGKHGVNTFKDWSHTRADEGRTPDRVYRITFQDSYINAVYGAAAKERNRPAWDWMPTSGQETNCTIAAVNTLAAGGLMAFNLYAVMPPYSPNNFIDGMDALSRSKPNVKSISVIPW